MRELNIGGISAKELARRFGTPLYAYDAAIIRARAKELRSAFPEAKFHYAIKANTNPEILKLIRGSGFGAEAVSLGEVRAALRAGFRPQDMSFTCSNLETGELRAVAKKGILMHLDSLGQLKTFGRLHLGREVSLRVNQGIGAGHHSHVITGGPESKFGIDISQLVKAKSLAGKYGLTITGLQQHIGSNVLDEKILLKAARALLGTARDFPDANRLDFGGGFGIPYRPGERRMDIRKFAAGFYRELRKFENETGRKLHIAFEPGRYLVAEAGMLLVSVADIKKNPSRTFVGVNSGFNHLIRPAMYGSYHKIANASRNGGRKKKVSVAGNVCESGDVFARDRMLPECRVGDTLAILNAGAYGYSMASRYNSRDLPKEVLVDGKRIKSA